MEKFINLPIKKQSTIINAGLNAFGTNGYKKASIKDIADIAGISKSMIFHYFGSKKEMYLFIAEYSANILINEVREHFNETETDFFSRIGKMAEIEVSVMRRHPAIFAFLKSLYFEADEEVAEEIKKMMMQGEAFRNGIGLVGIDTAKFKDGIDPKLVLKMLTWIAEGYISEIRDRADIEIDDLNREFNQCLELLKQNFYKEEYL